MRAVLLLMTQTNPRRSTIVKRAIKLKFQSFASFILYLRRRDDRRRRGGKVFKQIPHSYAVSHSALQSIKIISLIDYTDWDFGC